VTASRDGTARLWDVASGEVLTVLRGHTGEVNQAVFSPNGQRLVTASKDGTAQLWDVASGEALVVFRGHVGGVNQVAFSPDGQRVVTASNDNTARLWGIMTAHGQDLIDYARDIVPRELSAEERKRFFLE
jgi:WD40 repeat protein